MNPKITVLVGAPSYAPGILYKIFADRPKIETFFRPFTPNLDLIAGHLKICRSDPTLYPWYLDRYNQYAELFSQYPTSVTESIRPFLIKCASVGAEHIVFDLGSKPEQWNDLSELWPNSKWIWIGEPPVGLKVFQTSLAQLQNDYVGIGGEILKYCGISEPEDCQIHFNSDWVNLDYAKRGLNFWTRETSVAHDLNRRQLAIYLELKAAIYTLGKMEADISSLNTQLQAERIVSSQRLKIIEELNHEVNRLRSSALHIGSSSNEVEVKTGVGQMKYQNSPGLFNKPRKKFFGFRSCLCRLDSWRKRGQ